MRRQRLHAGGSSAARVLSRVVVALVALVLVWYGAMLALLAFGVDAATVNALSGYRTAFDALAGLQASDVGSGDRLVVAITGVVLALIGAVGAWAGFPRPRLARTDVDLRDGGGPGATTVRPRAIERIAESSAYEHDGVHGARARYDDDAIVLSITVRDANRLAAIAREVRDAAVDRVREHGITAAHVDVTVGAYDRQSRRDLA